MSYTKTHLQVALLTILCFAALSFSISVFLPPRFESHVSVLVIQKQPSDKVDAFSATKSAEFLSGTLSRVIYTYSFFKEVQNAPFDVRKNFSFDAEQRQKEWGDAVKVKKVNNTGIISITVRDRERAKAEGTAQAIAWTLLTKGSQYHGGGNRVAIKVIDGPNTPLRQTIPNIPLNTLLGLFVGVLVIWMIAVFFPSIVYALGHSVRNTSQNAKKKSQREKTVITK